MKKYIIPILMLLMGTVGCVEGEETQSEKQTAAITGKTCLKAPDGEIFCPKDSNSSDPDGQSIDGDPEGEDVYCYFDEQPTTPEEADSASYTCESERRVDPNDPDGQGGDTDPEGEEVYCYFDVQPTTPEEADDATVSCGSEKRVDPNDPDGKGGDKDPEGGNVSGCTNPDYKECLKED